MSTWKERKHYRKEYYEKFIYGWKMRSCTACNGSGYYDHHGSPRCSACDGTGKEKYRGDKSIEIGRRAAPDAGTDERFERCAADWALIESLVPKMGRKPKY